MCGPGSARVRRERHGGVGQPVRHRRPGRGAHSRRVRRRLRPWVGLSLGGLVGLHIVARHPDAVRSLLVSGVPFGSLSVPLRVANRLLLWLYCRRWGAAVVARVFRMPDEESRRAFLDSAARTDPTALRRIYTELDGKAI